MTLSDQSTTGWDSQGLAATYLLATPLLGRRAAAFIDFERHEIHFEEMLAESWSSGERVMISAAYDLFNGGGHCTLDELVSTLDERNLEHVIEAIAIRRRRR